MLNMVAFVSGRALAVGMALGLTGGALLLVTLPRANLPCEVTVTYSSREFIPAGKHAAWGRIVETTKQKVLRGRGSFGPKSLSCNLDLQRTEGV